MHASWMFKPKHGIDIVEKVVGCFANKHLDWPHNGVDWCFKEASREGWYVLDVYLDSGNCEYYSETSFSDEPISGTDLTDGLLVLLVEAGVAYNYPDDENPNNWYLEEVDITTVLAALAAPETSVFAPVGTKCYIHPSTDSKKTPYHVDMLEALFTLEAA